MPQPRISDGTRAVVREGLRDRAYAQDYRPTIVDRFRVWPSARQMGRLPVRWLVNASEISDADTMLSSFEPSFTMSEIFGRCWVRAGFLPSRIHCFSHKFGLNTFAVCRSSASQRG